MRKLIFLTIFLIPAAHADEAADVRAFFEELVERSNAFDTEVAKLYSPMARIITLRDGTKTMEMTGSQWQELVKQTMPLAERRGDTATYENVRVSAEGERFRVHAIRTPAVKCVADPNYYLDVVRDGGSWRVIEEYSETVSLSQCEPSRKLATSLKTIQKGILPHLPLDLDADTRLEGVDVVGPVLIYHERLHTITADEIDLAKLVPALRQIGVQNACGLNAIRALIEEGATVRYEYVDRPGELLANVDIMPGLCGAIP